MHRDRGTLRPIPIDEHSQWTAVRAFCRGAALDEPRNDFASRRRYVHALPITTNDGLPVGVVTVITHRTREHTVLHDLPETVQATFDHALRDVTADPRPALPRDVTSSSDGHVSMSSMATEHPKIEHQLPNGDVLVIATTKRDPAVEAVFDLAVEKARRDIRARFIALRKAQQAA